LADESPHDSFNYPYRHPDDSPNAFPLIAKEEPMQQSPYQLFWVIVLTFSMLLAFVSTKSTMGQIPVPSVLPDYMLYRVSVASDRTEGNDHSFYSSISANGRYVAFDSAASNLVPGDNNGSIDIFVHDNYTGETTLVSVTSDGEEANWFSNEPSISADGRFIVFHSYASNLVPDDTNLMRDVLCTIAKQGQRLASQ
jgi:Tol biopolymer transport system component